MPKYRIVKGKTGRRSKGGSGRTVITRPGDIVELTEEQAAAMGDRVEPEDAPKSAKKPAAPLRPPKRGRRGKDGRIEITRPGGPVVGNTSTAKRTEAERDADVHSTPVDEALKMIGTIEDAGHLQTIADREARHPKVRGGRKTVLKAVADRLAALATVVT